MSQHSASSSIRPFTDLPVRTLLRETADKLHVISFEAPRRRSEEHPLPERMRVIADTCVESPDSSADTLHDFVRTRLLPILSESMHAFDRHAIDGVPTPIVRQHGRQASRLLRDLHAALDARFDDSGSPPAITDGGHNDLPVAH